MNKRWFFLILALLVGALVWGCGLAAFAQSGGQAPSAPRASTGGNVELVRQLGGAVDAVARQGSTVYMGEGALLVILDVSNPAVPTRLGEIGPFTDVVVDIAVADDRAYVAAGDVLHVVDVSTPSAPTQVGTLELSGISSLLAAGTYVYAGDALGLHVIDVTHPASPVAVGRYAPNGTPIGGLALRGNYLYVTEGLWGGVAVVDVSDPRRPVVAARPSQVNGTAPTDVALVDDYAYVAAGTINRQGGLFVFNIADPGDPVYVDFYAMNGLRYVAAQADRLYVLSVAQNAEGPSYLQVMDCTNPAEPVSVGGLDIKGYVQAVAVGGGHLYLALHGGGLEVVNVAGVSGPVERGFYYPPGEVLDVVGGGKYVYAATKAAGVRIVDVSDPAAPQEVGVYTTSIDSKLVGADASHLYMAEGKLLTIIDASTPPALRALGVYTAANRTGFIEVVRRVGSYLYVSGLGLDLEIVDITDSAHPQRVGTLRASYIRDIALDGAYVYLAEMWQFRVLDASNPAAPVVRSVYSPPSSSQVIYAVEAAKGRAFVAEHQSNEVTALRVMDVSDPDHPALLGELDVPPVQDMALAGDTLYLAAGSLRVVDVSDPMQPQQVGAVGGWSPQGIAVVDRSSDRNAATGSSSRYVYAAAGWKGFRVVDASGVSPPLPVTRYSLWPVNPQQVVVANGYAYVADGGGGLKVLDVSDPAAPAPIGLLPAPGSFTFVALAGQYAYLGDPTNTQGFYVVDVSDPAAPRQVGSLTRSSYLGRESRELAVNGQVVYQANMYYGLVTYDVSNPITPTTTGRPFLYADMLTNDVAVLANRVYVANACSPDWCNQPGLRILDASSPLTPTEMGFYDAWSASLVAVSPGYAYVAASGGLHVLDVSDPSAPQEVGALSLADAGGFVDMATLGKGARVHVALLTGPESNDTLTLRVLDVSNPAAAMEVGRYTLPRPLYATWAPSLAGDDAYIYIADGEQGFYILRYTGAQGSSLFLPLVRSR